MDLKRFLARIGYDGPVKANLETLAHLQERFLLSVPFENLDIHYGDLDIVPDVDLIFDKIVTRRRGGFCYECNLLMAQALREMGFHVDIFSAQMMPSSLGSFLDDLHVFLHVTVDGWPYGVDVGNGRSFRHPLCEEGRIEQRIPEGLRFRFGPYHHNDHTGKPWRGLFSSPLDSEDWTPRFVYEREDRDPFYFKEACRFQQQSSTSTFTQKPFASLALPDGRITATPRALRENKMGVVTETLFETEADFLACLKDRFGLQPEGPRRNPLAGSSGEERDPALL